MFCYRQESTIEGKKYRGHREKINAEVTEDAENTEEQNEY